ncbi:MAG: hypothetical protein J3R72DRAFT_238936, partial [Linnemannia gamsii]
SCPRVTLSLPRSLLAQITRSHLLVHFVQLCHQFPHIHLQPCNSNQLQSPSTIALRMTQYTDTNMQAVRCINENGQPSSEATASDIIHIACYPDPALGKDIVLWDDIVAAFKADVVNVRTGTYVLPFLKGPNFKNLDPLRIAAVPGVTLDVVVKNQLGKQELPLKSLQEAQFGTQQENILPTSTPDAEGGPLGNGHLAAQPQEDATPPKVVAPQERILTAVQKFVQVGLKARLGDKDAQFALGEMYDRGQGTVQSASQALEWYEKAAEQGLIVAQYTAGMGHRYGQGEDKNERNCYGYNWLIKAANQGHAAAQYEVGLMLTQDVARPHYPDSDIDHEWYLKAADQGHADAQYTLGNMYYNGESFSTDYSSAMNYYLKAANQGHVSASSCAGKMYCIGQGVTQDYFKAAEWYLKAAAQGDKEAQYALAVLYEIGLGVTEDKTMAIEWYQKAADGGYSDAQKALDRLKE